MIYIDGEEDLVVLPLIQNLPVHSLVLYGQPDAGVVLCEITQDIRERANKFISYFVRI